MEILIIFFILGYLYSRIINFNSKGLLCCGIAGYSGKRSGHNFDKLKILLLDNQSRGEHSTGVHGAFMLKLAEKASEFIRNANFIDAVRSTEVIMHTRWATMGAKTAENAHPFEYGKVVGTHNGQISNYAELAKTHDVPSPVVDSQIVYSVFEKNGYDWDVISKVEGTVALAWKYEDKLFLFRRNNPLYIGRFHGGLYYSSREESLKMIACEGIEELPKNIIHIYKQGELVATQPVAEPVYVQRYADWTKGSCSLRINVIDKNVPTKKYKVEITTAEDNFWRYSDYNGHIHIPYFRAGSRAIIIRSKEFSDETKGVLFGDERYTKLLRFDAEGSYVINVYVDPKSAENSRYEFLNYKEERTGGSTGKKSKKKERKVEPGTHLRITKGGCVTTDGTATATISGTESSKNKYLTRIDQVNRIHKDLIAKNRNRLKRINDDMIMYESELMNKDTIYTKFELENIIRILKDEKKNIIKFLKDLYAPTK